MQVYQTPMSIFSPIYEVVEARSLECGKKCIYFTLDLVGANNEKRKEMIMVFLIVYFYIAGRNGR